MEDPLHRRNIIRIPISDGLEDATGINDDAMATVVEACSMDACDDAEDSGGGGDGGGDAKKKIRIGTRESRDASVVENRPLMKGNGDQRHLDIQVDRPTDQEGWRHLTCFRWPGIAALLDRDPVGIRDCSSTEVRIGDWEAIFDWLDHTEVKWLSSRYKNAVVMGVNFTDLHSNFHPSTHTRVVRPVGINKHFAVNMVAYAKNAPLEKYGEAYRFHWHLEFLPVCTMAIQTKQDTTDESSWTPKWRRERDLSIANVHITCLGHDNTFAACMSVPGKGGREDDLVVGLYQLYLGKKAKLIAQQVLLKSGEVPTAIACTKQYVFIGYRSGGICVMRRKNAVYHEWTVDVLADNQPIRSVSLDFDASDQLLAMFGIEDERGSIIAMNLGPLDEKLGRVDEERFCVIQQAVNGSEEHMKQGFVWIQSFWPKHEEMLKSESKRKLLEEDASFSPCEAPVNVRYVNEPNGDQIFLINSTNNVKMLRISKKDQFKRNYFLPKVGTFVDVQIYGDVLCGHTAKNGVLIGSLNQGCFMHETQTAEFGANQYVMQYHYRSVQMFAERVAVLLTTGDVIFLVLK